MLKMIVDISDVINVINRKLKKFRAPVNGITRTEEQRVKELLLRRFICQDVTCVDDESKTTVNRAVKSLLNDAEVDDELHYYGDVVGDMVMRYFNYIDDELGYNCKMRLDVRRKVIIILGDDEWLRRTIDRFELI